MVILPNISLPAAQDNVVRDQVRDQIRQQVRDAIAASRDAQREVQAELAGQTDGARAAMEVLRAEIAAEQANMKALTEQLTPGLSAARQEAISDQISVASDHLQSLQEQLEHVITMQVPGGTLEPPPLPGNDIPPRVVDVSIALFITIAVVVIGNPIARAIGRWMDRRGQVAVAPANMEPRFDRMEQAIEAIAIEVERVSEGQRYTNKLMSEIRALPAPNAVDQWPQGGKQGVGVPVERAK